RHVRGRDLGRLFALKSWANGVFAQRPGMGPSVADAISQKWFSLVPEKIPARLLEYRDRFDHHLLVVVSGSQREAAAQLLEEVFAAPEHEGAFYERDGEEAQRAAPIRFGG